MSANINDYLQVKKSTGEILTMKQPIYRGRELSDVYGKYSSNKRIAFDNCLELLKDFTKENGIILNRGITSHSWNSFVFCGVFETNGIKYVMRCSSNRKNYNGSEEYNTCFMIVKLYLLEE